MIFTQSTANRERNIEIGFWKDNSEDTDGRHSSMKFETNRMIRKEYRRFNGHQKWRKQAEIDSTDFEFERMDSCVFQRQRLSFLDYRNRLRTAEVIARKVEFSDSILDSEGRYA